MGINYEENQRMRNMIKGMILGVKTKRECIYISRMITNETLKGYELDGLEEELFYKKERWLVDLTPN